MYEYDLFAVINHEGQMDNGHYTNFARFQDEVCFVLLLSFP
jgi:ubiquitin carboxyl-terminal hydrolase 22/27/51